MAFEVFPHSSQREKDTMNTDSPKSTKEAMLPRYAVVSDQGGAKTYILAFGKGEEVMSGLQAFVKEERLYGGSLSAIGAFSDALLGSGRPIFDHVSKEYKMIPVKEQAEVVSLTGNIALVGGEARLHVHAVLGLPDGSARVGHVFEAHAWPTLEVVLVAWQKPAWRSLDEETGMQILIP
ncbi:MAG: PPC domain-containing DNA-binding protein [Pseudonocardiaceae bacterium]